MRGYRGGVGHLDGFVLGLSVVLSAHREYYAFTGTHQTSGRKSPGSSP